MSYSAKIAVFATGDLEADAEKASLVMTELARRPSAFSRWRALCNDGCGTCEICVAAKAAVAAELLRPDARVWEVYNAGGVVPLGILRLSRIRPGTEAVLDFSFFDNKMSDKIGLLEDLIQSSFSAQDDAWVPLRRLVAEMPAHAFFQLRTFMKMGFGGPFRVAYAGHKFGATAIIPTPDPRIGALVTMALEAVNG